MQYSFVDFVKVSMPSLVTSIVSSILTPYFPGMYMPGSTASTMFSFKVLSLLGDSIGSSWTFIPTPCPKCMH